MVEAILFDMDGVLVDSEQYWQAHWTNDIFPRVQSGDPTMDEITGRSIGDIVSYLHDTYRFDVEPSEIEAETLSFAEQMYQEQANVVSGMPSLFATLRGSDIEIGIVSSARRQWIELVLEESELGTPDVVVSASDLEAPSKPNPAIYERAIEQLQTSASACIVVEDSIQGARAAESAGATVVRYQCNQPTEPISEAEYVADDIADLQNRLTELIEI
jgi:HAD superfamily hydrolase (TIGR01509 family)